MQSYEGIVDPALKSKQGRSSIKSTSRLPKAKVSDSNQILGGTIDKSDQSIIDLLRRQLDEAHCRIRDGEVEINSLKSAVAAREQELSRASKLIGNGAVNSTMQDPSPSAGHRIITEMDPTSVDLANKRIIDQLNSQVDFLNSHLSFREVQIAELYQHANELQDSKLEVTHK